MIAFILGTRPEILKLQPVIEKIPPAQRVVIWTGQHWSKALAKGVMDDCCFSPDDGIEADLVDDFGPISAGERLARMLSAIRSHFEEKGFSWVVVQGDTDSALAGALAAVKSGLRVFHVEAGSRSGDPMQPEETNRKLIDHCASAWACSYLCDVGNLNGEGINPTLFAGDTLIDNLKAWEASSAPAYDGHTVLVTLHRAETLDDEQALREIFSFLVDISTEKNVILLAHPHLWKAASDNLIALGDYPFKTIDCLPPTEFRSALRGADLFITDSGGAATEAAYFGVKTIIARDVTELEDVRHSGRIILGGRTRRSLTDAWQEWQACAVPGLTPELQQAWDGKASERIAEVLLR